MGSTFYNVVLAAIVLVNTTITVTGCPHGWVEFTESCYNFIYYPPLQYTEAKRTCRTYGSYLVSINTDQEFNFISEWLKKHEKNRLNQWWTSGVVEDNSVIWEGGATGNISMSKNWIDSGYTDNFENGNIITLAHSTSFNTFKASTAKPEANLAYICKISRNEVYRLLQQDRDHMYGTNITNPNDVQYGPKIIIQPKTVIVAGTTDNVELECVAVSNPRPSYNWYKVSDTGTTDMLVSDSHHIISNGKLFISDPVEALDDGTYYCAASNSLGTVLSEPVQIHFGYLQEFSNVQPSSVTAHMYNGIEIPCSPPLYNPAISINWYKEDGGPNFLRTDLHPHLFVSMNGKLYLSETSAQDAGSYHCFVTLVPMVSQQLASHQPPSRTSLGIGLTIAGGSPSEYGPEIHDDFPVAFPVPSLRGEVLTIECFAYGKLPLYYSWKKDNGPLPNKAVISDHGRVITFPDAQLEDAGNYTCRVERGSSGVAEKSFVLAIQAKPFFTSTLKDQHIDIGSQLTWQCDGMGVPTPVYTWYKNGQMLSSIEGDLQIVSSTLTIFNADPSQHQGMYQCRATNIHGTAFSTAQLRVLAFKPTFARNPMKPSQMATVGGSVMLECQPEAAPSATITWEKDGLQLATSPDGRWVQLSNGNLQIKELQTSDQGSYQCTAVNNLGSDSSSGKLTVVAQIVMSVIPVNTRVDVNATTFLACQASYDSKRKEVVYVWDLNGRPIDYDIEPHFTMASSGEVSGLYITNAQVYHTGLYGCSAVSVDEVVRVTAYLTVFGPPGECGGVVAEVKGDNVTLKWVMGPNNMAEISKFHIEYNTVVNTQWRVLEKDIPLLGAIDHNRDDRCLYHVIGLKPGSSYRFRVVAYNRFGPGPASLPSTIYKIPDSAPVVAVNKIYEGWGPVGTLAIEWEQLNEEDLTGEGIGYKLYYRKNSTGTESLWSTAEVLGHTNTFSALVGAENYYLAYDVKISAFNNLGHGPNSSVVVIMSQGDMPVGVATNLNAESYNATAVVLEWTPVPLIREFVRGKVIGYGINYWEDVDGASLDSANMYCSEDCGSVIIIGLQPDSYYWFNVQVFTTAGMGTLSEDTYGSTFDARVVVAFY
ncbi:contactin-5-like isoform X2 [Physella acuta]|uniref:contactin-5-like isoform X2 n=1 Tax=Physella acuta TaxID=109671 RepID=UPI0027DB8190|nr:contactin-5-like isoform X2 [Physella acuta]